MDTAQRSPGGVPAETGQIRTLRQFRDLDLLVFCVFAALAETLSLVLSRSMRVGFQYSPSLAIAIVSMIRWGPAGAVVYAAAGLPAALLSGLSVPAALLYHVAASLFAGIPALAYGKRDRDRLASDRLRLSLYVLSCHLCLSLGKGLTLLIIAGELSGALDHFASMLLTLAVNVLLCALLAGAGDLVCDMRNYVARVNKENG